MESTSVQRTTRFAVAGLLLGLTLASVSCAPSGAGTQAALSSYFDAVQSGDHQRVATSLLGCAVEGSCLEDIAAHDASVLAQRELLQYRFDQDWGFGLIVALRLGRGGYWTVKDIAVQEQGGVTSAQLVFRVSTGYDGKRTRSLPMGAEIEYLVRPLGEVRVLVRGERTLSALRDELRLLDIRAELQLVEQADGEEVWKVSGLRPILGSAVFQTVTWRPE